MIPLSKGKRIIEGLYSECPMLCRAEGCGIDNQMEKEILTGVAIHDLGYAKNLEAGANRYLSQMPL